MTTTLLIQYLKWWHRWYAWESLQGIHEQTQKREKDKNPELKRLHLPSDLMWKIVSYCTSCRLWMFSVIHTLLLPLNIYLQQRCQWKTFLYSNKHKPLAEPLLWIKPLSRLHCACETSQSTYLCLVWWVWLLWLEWKIMAHVECALGKVLQGCCSTGTSLFLPLYIMGMCEWNISQSDMSACWTFL